MPEARPGLFDAAAASSKSKRPGRNHPGDAVFHTKIESRLLAVPDGFRVVWKSTWIQCAPQSPSQLSLRMHSFPSCVCESEGDSDAARIKFGGVYEAFLFSTYSCWPPPACSPAQTFSRTDQAAPPPASDQGEEAKALLACAQMVVDQLNELRFQNVAVRDFRARFQKQRTLPGRRTGP